MRSLIAWIALVAASTGAAGYNPRRRLVDSSDCTCDIDSEAGEGLSALSSEPTDRSALSRSLSWRASAPNLGHQAARKGGRAPL